MRKMELPEIDNTAGIEPYLFEPGCDTCCSNTSSEDTESEPDDEEGQNMGPDPSEWYSRNFPVRRLSYFHFVRSEILVLSVCVLFFFL